MDSAHLAQNVSELSAKAQAEQQVPPHLTQRSSRGRIRLPQLQSLSTGPDSLSILLANLKPALKGEQDHEDETIQKRRRSTANGGHPCKIVEIQGLPRVAGSPEGHSPKTPVDRPGNLPVRRPAL